VSGFAEGDVANPAAGFSKRRRMILPLLGEAGVRASVWLTLLVPVSLFLSGNVSAAPSDSPADPTRDREMRERYEGVLLKNPFQDRAFNQVYESYAKIEG